MYHYPPPFLLLPAAIRLVAPEFLATRAVWFMLQSLLLAAALVMVSRWIGGVPGAWAAALGWLVLASPAVLMTLQVGNFQVTVYSLAIIAFVLIATGRELTGASLLAYATVGKIVPGVLVLFLLTARRWRAVIYTAAFSLLLGAITVGAFGWKPIGDFIWYRCRSSQVGRRSRKRNGSARRCRTCLSMEKPCACADCSRRGSG